MSADFYGEMANTARELIGEFGTDVTLTRKVDGLVNPITGGYDVEPQTWIYETKGVRQNYTADEIDGTLILKTDVKVVVDGTVEPQVGDTLTLGGVALGRVVMVEPKSPTGIPLAYTLAVRK